MGSRRLFFKTMKEDLRHKVWMIALSSLVSFLALPVVWLSVASRAITLWADAWKGNEYRYYQEIEILIRDLTESVYTYLILMGGTIAVVGALITGLAGFRYLFHKNMVDIYHSLPVKRNTLFGACYVDGILIWFVPFFSFLVVTAIMMFSFLGRLDIRGQDIAILLISVSAAILVLIVVFLLVYNLALVAVMLSGNILNTLVSMMILGIGAVCVWGMGVVFCAYYLASFYSERLEVGIVAYFSPLISGNYLLYAFGDVTEIAAAMGRLFLNFLIAALLGLGAWHLYRKRDSELAEQGIRNKAMALLLKVITAVAAGMGGWQIFIMLVGDGAVLWGSFGLVLVAVITFGVLDIIFNMDFKAFFAHKLQMAAVVAISLFLCYAFYWDWFGYDTYLPKQEEIAEIAIYDFKNANCYGTVRMEAYVLENMHYQDAEVIHAYLEKMVEGIKRAKEGEDASASAAGGYGSWTWHEVTAKVTLKSGRSYYRNYMVWDKDWDIMWPLLTSEEYLRYAYCVSDEEVAECYDIMLGRNRSQRLEDFGQEMLASIVQAYNEDVLENPEAALLGGGRLLAEMTLHTWKNKDLGVIVLDIYESMERTVEAMRRAGLQEWVDMAEPSEISSIGLTLESLYLVGNEDTAESYIAGAMEKYGVYLQETAEGSDSAISDEMATSYLYTDKSVTLDITDQEEIRELLQYISYALPKSISFGEDYVSIEYTRQDGETQECYIRKGLLPEKYILRFGEL